MKNSLATFLRAHLFTPSRKQVVGSTAAILLFLVVTTALYAQEMIYLPFVRNDDGLSQSAEKDHQAYLPYVPNDTGSKDTPSPTPVSGDTTSWKTYEDTVSGFSFKYPPDWKAGKIPETSIVTTIVPAYVTERYRAIRIAGFKTSENQAEAASIEELNASTRIRIAESYDVPIHMMKSLQVKSFDTGKSQGIEISHYPYVIGIHTTSKVYRGDMTYVFELSEGGHHEGIPDYDDPLAQEDLQLMYRIIDTLEFTTK